ncbi:MAG: hypothetical protein BroJett040_20530 [Oligoflexia bacterium]|nr:MAG: hypothetical protein BroJett040_20530 [Oligoflexia bacterium]
MRLKGKRFLFIDDEEALLFAYRYLVQAEGAEVHTATHLQAAVELVNKYNFDYVISDYNMPEVTGYDILYQIHQVQRAAKLYIISGTVNLDIMKKVDVHHILAATLEKPFARETLVELFAGEQ